MNTVLLVAWSALALWILLDTLRELKRALR